MQVRGKPANPFARRNVGPDQSQTRPKCENNPSGFVVRIKPGLSVVDVVPRHFERVAEVGELLPLCCGDGQVLDCSRSEPGHAGRLADGVEGGCDRRVRVQSGSDPCHQNDCELYRADGFVQPQAPWGKGFPRRHRGRLGKPYCPLVAAAASPRTTFTSLPLPTPRICVAAPRLAAISR